MKILVRSVFLTPLLVAQFAAMTSGVLLGADLDVDAVIARHVAALGGAEKVRAIQSLKMTGTIVLGGGQVEAPVVTWVKRPASARSEVTFAGRPIVQAFDGAIAWTVNPMNGSVDPQLMAMDQAQSFSDIADRLEGPLMGYRENGNRVELLGLEGNGPKVHRLKVTYKNGRVSTVFLDASTFLHVKTVTAATGLAPGQASETEVAYSDHRPVAGGLVVAHSSTVRANGRVVAEQRIDKVEVNVAMDDGMFRMPVRQVPVPAGVPVAPKRPPAK